MPLQETSGAASYDAFGGGAPAVAPLAESIDFDGTTDFLRRTSDLSGNAPGKTFTFSCWFYAISGTSNTILYAAYNSSNDLVTFQVRLEFNGVRVQGLNTAGSNVLILSADIPQDSKVRTFYNVLISVDISNSARRHIYVNDIPLSLGVAGYENENIWFNPNQHFVHGVNDVASPTARLSNIYFDKTYRDLTNVANRRLFVTADLRPALGQAALNPIMYLPLSDPTAPGLNQGTGGNFTLLGTVARSGRGPNQYNAPYSDLDGSADYLSRTTAPTGIADSSTFTVHCAFTADSVSTAQKIVFFGSDASNRFQVAIDPSGQINLQGYNASGTQLLGVTTVASIVVGRNYVLDVSVALFNSSSRHFFINGQAAAVTWDVYTGGSIDFNIATTPRYHIGANTSTSPSQFFNGRLGALWFNTGYIDLSVPANLAKFVSGTGINAAPVDLGATGQLPTGTSPQLYLPMYGNDAGRNYGTGGDFTVNSGPFNGARGPNEWLGNWRDVFAGAGSYIRRTTGLIGATNVNTFTCSAWFYANTAGAYQLFFIAGTVNGYDRVAVSMDNGRLKVRVANSTDTGYVLAWQSSSSSLITTGFIYNVLVSRSGTTIQAFLNGVSVPGTASPSGSGEMTIVNRPVYIGASNDSSGSSGSFWVGEVYFNTHYTDFSQEANRLLFRDAFNTPTNLPSLILNGSVPNPLVYLRTGPSDPGENSGTGGAFTSTLNVDRGQF